jgi:tetratricopeptide (TPR) repeat protein
MDSVDQSIAVLQSAWKRNPGNKRISTELGSVFMLLAMRAESRKDTAALRTSCMETIRWRPDHTPALEKLAALDEEQGKLKAAAQWIEQLIRHAPDSDHWITRQNHLESRIRLAQDEYETGMKLKEKQDLLNAETRFEAALQIFKSWSECAYALHWTRGTRLYRDGKIKSLKASVESFRKASIAKPGESDAYYWMGKAYERLDPNGFDSILEAYRTFVSLESGGPRFIEISGRIRELSEKKKKWDAFWGSGRQP